MIGLIKRKRIQRGFMALFIILGLLFGLRVSVQAQESVDGKQVDVLFTHDLHSYLEGYSIARDGENVSIGGFARMKTLLDEKREKNPNLLVLDAGDIAMGTLYQTLFESEALELRMLGELSFDATTFGNHDFDYGSEALANMYRTASKKANLLPYFVVCNIDWTSENEGSSKIYEALKDCNLREYVVLDKGDTRIAVTGVFGKDALECAPTCELTVLDPIESVRSTVEKIDRNEDVDMIVCVSHSGTWSDPEKSEDELLAKAVPKLDVIVSGHSHTSLEKPIKWGDTYIVSSGCYGADIGSCHLVQRADGRWEMDNYELISLTEAVVEDAETVSRIEAIEDGIEKAYLKGYGLSTDQVLAVNDITFETVDDLGNNHTEQRLGNLMSDSYRYAANLVPEGKKHPFDVAVVPAGTVRGTYLKGEITVSDVFESFSLGSGADGSVGYPLISVYLTGKELKNVAEVDASISDYMTTARLYMSGLSFSYNPHRMLLNKVSDIWLTSGLMDDSRIELEDDQMYRVVTDLYSGRMLGAVTKLSKGMLSIIPKEENGQPIETFEDAIIYDSEGKELKAWLAIAQYMTSFEKNEERMSEIPAYYASYHDRKVVEESLTPIAFFRNPNRFLVGAFVVFILIITLLVFAVRSIIKRKKRNKLNK